MIKMLSLALIALGALLAPAYWVYAKFYTGSQAQRLDLTVAEGWAAEARRWVSPDFVLNPDMAPVGLVLLAQGHFSPNMDESKPPRDLYAVTLYRQGEAAQPLQISLGVSQVTDTNPSFREHLLLMQHVQPGTYRMEVTALKPPVIQIERMQLQVRQHLHEPDPRIVTAGIVVFILGLLGLVIG
ncbi:MAG TPA: hypothetical protein PKH69_08915 [Thiobacillaceae bacterium]|nr:hypothetical protein [Thiobacillaceae bacterium]HNU64510.1 hypothetical protein [Thiobacillaceae bacterium]